MPAGVMVKDSKVVVSRIAGGFAAVGVTHADGGICCCINWIQAKACSDDADLNLWFPIVRVDGTTYVDTKGRGNRDDYVPAADIEAFFSLPDSATPCKTYYIRAANNKSLTPGTLAGSVTIQKETRCCKCCQCSSTTPPAIKAEFDGTTFGGWIGTVGTFGDAGLAFPATSYLLLSIGGPLTLDNESYCMCLDECNEQCCNWTTRVKGAWEPTIASGYYSDATGTLDTKVVDSYVEATATKSADTAFVMRVMLHVIVRVTRTDRTTFDGTLSLWLFDSNFTTDPDNSDGSCDDGPYVCVNDVRDASGNPVTVPIAFTSGDAFSGNAYPVSVVGTATLTPLEENCPDSCFGEEYFNETDGLTSCVKVIGGYDSDQVRFFSHGMCFTPGDYIISYDGGAMTYDDGVVSGTPQGYRVNDFPNNGFRIVSSYGSVIANAPGDSTEYASPDDAVSASTGTAVTITHTGGPIGIQLINGSGAELYQDNAPMPISGPPRFKLCGPS